MCTKSFLVPTLPQALNVNGADSKMFAATRQEDVVRGNTYRPDS